MRNERKRSRVCREKEGEKREYGEGGVIYDNYMRFFCLEQKTTSNWNHRIKLHTCLSSFSSSPFIAFTTGAKLVTFIIE